MSSSSRFRVVFEIDSKGIRRQRYEISLIYARGEVFFEEEMHYKVIPKKDSQSFKGPPPPYPLPKGAGEFGCAYNLYPFAAECRVYHPAIAAASLWCGLETAPPLPPLRGRRGRGKAYQTFFLYAKRLSNLVVRQSLNTYGYGRLCVLSLLPNLLYFA